MLFGTGQRNALGPAFEAVHVHVIVAAATIGVGVVVFGPDAEKFFGELFGKVGVRFDEAFDVGERLFFFADFQIELRKDCVKFWCSEGETNSSHRSSGRTSKSSPVLMGVRPFPGPLKFCW